MEGFFISSCKSRRIRNSKQRLIAIIELSSSREVVNSGDSLKNCGIVREVAAVARGQDMPFFEVGKGMFNSDSTASEFGIAGLLGGRQRAIFRLFLRQNYRR